MINGKVSHWMSQETSPSRPSLGGSHRADFCIVGGGYTGLWTAYHVRQLQPEARIVILEKEHVGYGASGRNAGWLSPLVPGNRQKFAKAAQSREAGVQLQRRMLEAVDEVLEIITREGIDAEARRTGNLVVARTPAAMQRLRQRMSKDRAWGYPESGVEELSESQVRARVNVADLEGGLFYPTVARLNPGKLVRELARICESLGVEIYEESQVDSVKDGRAVTATGSVDAGAVLLCVEGYSAALGRSPRRVIPINSSIIISEPLSAATWAEIGWQGYECVSDAAHVFSYLQRTDDGRILIGGRGSPYRYGSRTGGEGRNDSRTTDALRHRLHTLFPAAKATEIAHTWSGVLGVTRDWCASVEFDRGSGVGHAHGYAGHGVTSAYLAAKSLSELAVGHSKDDAALPWVNYRARNWEPEPIRWAGVHGMYSLFALADRWEEQARASKTSFLARAGSRLAGLND